MPGEEERPPAAIHYQVDDDVFAEVVAVLERYVDGSLDVYRGVKHIVRVVKTLH